MAKESSLKNMVCCLGAITLVCSSLLAGVYVLTADAIEEASALKTHKAIGEVSPSFDSIREDVAPDGSNYYSTLDADGQVVAYVITSSSSKGFGGALSLMTGFRPDGTVYNVAVLGHSETPGLGAKCTEQSFAGQFKGFDPSVRKLSVKKDGGDVDAITAATITSRAFCDAIQNAADVFAAINAGLHPQEEIVEEQANE